jgi:hypothetical protein
MKQIKILASLLLLLSMVACTDFVDPAIPYSTFETGTYLRTLEQPASFNFFQIADARFKLMVEAVDAENGATVQEVEVFVRRRRGATLTPEAKVTTVPVSAFQKHSIILTDVHPKSGSPYPAATIELTVLQALQALNLTAADINGGDFLEFRLSLTTKSGRVFTNSNLSPDIQGGLYYRSPFFYRVPFVCPSSLEGTFNYVQTEMFCDGQIEGTVTWTKITDNTYRSSDFSFGSWIHCYGASGGTPAGSLAISDACNVISVTGADQYGDRYTYAIENIQGTSLTIKWSNTYGELGTVVLTRQDGKSWPALRN